MEKEIILKKAVFGGFDCIQVMNCIADLQKRALEAKKDAEKLEVLQATLSELETVMKNQDDEIADLSASIAEAESKFRVSRASAQLVKDSVDYADRYVENAKIIAQDITEKTSLRVREAKEKIDSILSDIAGLSDDISILYADLGSLKSECDFFEDSYPSSSSENYLAEDETSAEDEAQVCSPSAVQTEDSAPLKDEEETLKLLRSLKEKYENMV
ncbi:MAG: hypothetical protein IK955_08975 [Clostridia bacterium]|nr:hypothetical protein [Clostridia bacterium]